MSGTGTPPQAFPPAFRAELDRLFLWRRDVRRFRTDPLPEGALERMLEAAAMAPSVGLSEPWRFVRVMSAEARAAVVAQFEAENAAALAEQAEADRDAYASLKLAGLREAPEHLAVFSAEETEQGRGLGRRTMPETLRYSVVCAVMQLWLAARAEGIGVGWVSILDPNAIARLFGTPPDWALVAYLCVGFPVEEHDDCELERAGWERRKRLEGKLFTV